MVISGIWNDMTTVLNYEKFKAQVGRLSFLELASSFRNRETSDPRDKIYGLLGLRRHVVQSLLIIAFLLKLPTRQSLYRLSVSQRNLTLSVTYSLSKTPILNHVQSLSQPYLHGLQTRHYTLTLEVFRI